MSDITLDSDQLILAVGRLLRYTEHGRGCPQRAQMFQMIADARPETRSCSCNYGLAHDGLMRMIRPEWHGPNGRAEREAWWDANRGKNLE